MKLRFLLMFLFIPQFAYANTIYLLIWPKQTFEKNDLTMAQVLVYGDFPKHQVQLISETNTSAFFNTVQFGTSGTKYVRDLYFTQKRLDDGDRSWYPLIWHRSFNGLPEGSELKVAECLAANWSQCKELPLPKKVRERILHYMFQNQEDRLHDGFHFVKYLLYLQDTGYTDSTTIGSATLAPPSTHQVGEIYGLHEPDSNRVRHAFLYLGEGLYLSKLGMGGPLIVSSFEEMAKKWPDTECLGDLSWSRVNYGTSTTKDVRIPKTYTATTCSIL